MSSAHTSPIARRYPRSATRIVTTFVRRQHTPPLYAGEAGAGGGGDFCPFPSHIGNLTRMIADLLSLPPVGSAANKTSSSEEGKDDGSEPGDICALRLARLEAWKLLDSPYAFQEMVSCAVLAMDATQLHAQGRGHHPHLVSLKIFCNTA